VQTIHKADQIVSSLHLIYLLFTRKPEGQSWRRMWRLAAGRELVRISASTIASRERVASSAGGRKPGRTETSLVPGLAAFAGTTFDELVQWMVEDASLDREDRRGPRLT
jgi:hypothetical protein